MVNSGLVGEIKRFATHDGPGIRTTVFIAGCPLDCKWCSNPELKKAFTTLYFISKRCEDQVNCIKVCPEGIISSDKANKLNREKCTLCMKCVKECTSGAFQQIVEEKSVEEIIAEISKDLPFYGQDGGLTLSGGEPLYQPEFSINVLRKSKMAGISTVLDTSGYASSDIIAEVSKFSDLVLYDIKHMDSAKHIEETGVENKIIIDNLVYMSGKTNVRVSLPLIPDFNDDEKNIEETSRFVKELNIKFIDINPFHNLGSDKYKFLGLSDPFANYPPIKKENIINTRKIIEKYGITTTIGRMM
jgi:pyruvate formate lyase activating enzyme